MESAKIVTPSNFSSGSSSRLRLPNDIFPYFEQKGKASLNRVWKILSCGWNSCHVKSAKFTWIAVQGKDSICVVTGDKIPIGCWESAFWESAFSEMKVHPLFGKTSYFDQWPKECAMAKPFAAVSVVLDTDPVYAETTHGALSAGLNEKKALNFLLKKIINCSDFTFEETMQTAISALLCLLPENINVTEIKAWVMRKGEQIQAFPVKEIEEHLYQPAPPCE